MKIGMKSLCVTIICIVIVPLEKIYAQNDSAFLSSPKLIQEPGLYYKYSVDSRKFTGISSMAISQNGRMWAVWYAGATPGEDNNNYVVVATSGDKGETWEEILTIDPDGNGPVRAFDPQVWLDPNDRLWVFWAQTIGHNGTVAGVWSITTDDVKKKFPEWTSPKRLTDGVMMNKPTVLSNGEWILPVSTWRLTGKSAKVVVSADQGKSWDIRGACHIPKEVRSFDEHMIVERNDGSLWMLVRTAYGIGKSESRDKGRTWTDLKDSNIEHPSARFFIRRLNSNNLLLVKHGPISVRTGRSHLMAFISKDDGKSWSKGLLLDERNGISYPDGVQADDGTIYITYDYSRTGAQKVFLTSFREEDVLSGKYDERIIDVFRSRKVISDGGK